jgi:hypothetical protein
MPCGCLEVLVRGQQHKVVPSTELDQQRIDGSYLHTTATTGVADFRRFDVILTAWLKEGESKEAFHKLGARLRPREALQQFLDDEPGREDLIGT